MYANLGFVDSKGMLLHDVIDSFLPRMREKLAFMFGLQIFYTL